MWEALRMMETGVVNPATLFSHQFKLDQVDDAFKTFHEKTDGAMKMLIRP
jgi:alcohol dehydrogenase